MHRKAHKLFVMDVVEQNDGKSVDLYIEKPYDMRFDPSDGVGIPASFTQNEFFKLRGLLATHDNAELLLPHDGLPGPDFSAPSDEFLKVLLDKTADALKDKSEICPYHANLAKNLKRLEIIIADEDLKERLQANYSVVDMLKLFPRIVDANTIIDTQPAEKGNKTYTADGRDGIEVNGVNCFRINVTQDDGPSYRALFGEAEPNGIKAGQSSTYLRSLKERDVLLVNEARKPGPQIPDDLGDNRAVILIAQGNSMIRMLPILQSIKARKELGEEFGPVHLVGAFKNKADIHEVDELIPYLDDGTLSQLHFCLSKDISSEAFSHDAINMHMGARVNQLFMQDGIFSDLAKPFVLISGGERFVLPVGEMIAELHNYDFDDVVDRKNLHRDMRISKSPDRKAALQGQPYEPLILPDQDEKAEMSRSHVTRPHI